MTMTMVMMTMTMVVNGDDDDNGNGGDEDDKHLPEQLLHLPEADVRQGEVGGGSFCRRWQYAQPCHTRLTAEALKVGVRLKMKEQETFPSTEQGAFLAS